MSSATAPAKLLILGEYAVLEGFPALVMAVNRLARCHAIPSDRNVLFAPQIDPEPVGFDLAGDQVRWSRDIEDRLDLVSACLEHAAAAGLLDRPVRLHLDTHDFFAGDEKLGLGSSAALSVALFRSLAEVHETELPRQALFDHARNAHVRFQGGSGSGVDIAAACWGGLLRYQVAEEPQITSLPWPNGLHVQAVWTGRSASTRQMLETLGRWRQQYPSDYQRHLQHLGEIAETGIGHAQNASIGPLLQSLADYGDALDAFGQEADLDVVSAPHRQVIQVASNHAVVYKPSGAGGGDFGLAFSNDPAALTAFSQAVDEAGFRPMDLAIYPSESPSPP